MDIIGLAELLKDETKSSIVREIVIVYDIVLNVEAEAVASIFRSCNKLNLLSLAGSDDSYASLAEDSYIDGINAALNGLEDLRELSIFGQFWNELFENPRSVLTWRY